MTKSIKIAVSIAFCLLVAFLGSVATQSSVGGWYTTLNKPFFNPPNWLFGPVWTLLYIMMGVSAGMVWNIKNKLLNKAMYWFGVQLLFNLSWSFAFFYFENPQSALVIIILLWISIYMSIRNFKPISAIAAYLLIPYLLWVSFATALNFEIWRLN